MTGIIEGTLNSINTNGLTVGSALVILLIVIGTLWKQNVALNKRVDELQDLRVSDQDKFNEKYLGLIERMLTQGKDGNLLLELMKDRIQQIFDGRNLQRGRG